MFSAFKTYSLYSLHILLVKPPFNAPPTPDVSVSFVFDSSHEKNYLREDLWLQKLFLFDIKKKKKAKVHLRLTLNSEVLSLP